MSAPILREQRRLNLSGRHGPVHLHNVANSINKSPPKRGHHAILPALLILLGMLLCFPHSARASCFNPAGQAGDLIYNSDWHIHQYCNGGAWVWFGVPKDIPATLKNGLVGWWKLDDGSSGTTPTTAADSSGNGNTGTTQNSPTWTANGKISNALILNGTNQRVDTGAVLGGGAVTVTGWLYPTGNGPGGTDDFFWEGNGGGTTRFYCVRSSFAGSLMYCGDNGSTTTNTTSVIPLNQWTHFAAVRTSGGLFTLYINGVQDGAANQNGGATSADGTGTNIGGHAWNNTTSFAGTIDDVRVYNRALSATEIAGLYNWGIAAPTAGLVGWWKLDDGSSGTTPTTAADSTGNGNTGTLTNSPTWTSAGKINNAVTFNAASSQYVNVPDVSMLDIAGSWTISGWVNPSALPSSGNAAVIAARVNSTLNPNYSILINNNYFPGGSSFAVYFKQSASQYYAVYSTTINTGTWYHVTGVWDSSTSNLYLYVNGALVSTANQSGHTPDSNGGGGLSIGSILNNSFFLSGTIDDVRVYNRALSATEVAQLYNATNPLQGACSNPTAVEGALQYNGGTHHVLQYCGLSGWQALGPDPGAGGAGCTGPAGSEGNIVYNSDYHVLTYCDGTNWVQLPKYRQPPLNGLVGWWNFDDGSSGTTPTTAVDSSGNGNTGTLTNSPVWTSSGKINNALTFSGGTDKVTLGGPTISTTYTISAWIKPQTGGANAYGDIIGAAANCNGIYYYKTTQVMDFCYGGGTDHYTSQTIPANSWSFITLVVNAGNGTFYLNGAPEGTTFSGVNGWTFGNIGNDTGGEAYQGTIDDVRVYNRALSASEIWQLYTAQ